MKSSILKLRPYCPHVKNYSSHPARPMSKCFNSFLLYLAFVLCIFGSAQGQNLSARIKIDAGPPAAAYVEGQFLTDRTGAGARSLSFVLDHAGITGLGERISDVRLVARDGSAVAHRRMMAGEYLADADFTSWSYAIDLSPLKNRAAAAHVSWLGPEGGIIMPYDLLPQSAGGNRSENITLDMPQGWIASSAERRTAQNMFDVADSDTAVIYIGKGRRERSINAGGSHLQLSLSGEWLFSDEEAAAMARSIYADYSQLFGSAPAGDVFIGISKFPIAMGTGQWEGVTRGRTVTIISSDMPFKNQSPQLLHEQLRHEIFHLWIPNGLNLTGRYDWFYEGFAEYRALKAGVMANSIRFDDFLNTLARAYDIDRRQKRDISLIDASKDRWSGANTNVYARGTLVAFLCDIALLDRSKGRRSVDDVLREIYKRHRRSEPSQDGNAAVLAVLRNYDELGPIINHNITGAMSLDWAVLLRSAGLAADSAGRQTKLAAAARLTGRQKDLLNKLGYNNWRTTPKLRQ